MGESPRQRTAAWVPGRTRTRPFAYGAQPREAEPALAPGTRIDDRYEVLGVIGEGGMGRVYRVRHVYLKRELALKVLRDEFAADPEHIARFEREAQVASSLGHPGIVQVVDFSRRPTGGAMLAMEFVDGVAMDLWLAEPRPLRDVLSCFASLAEALAAGHDAGVVHRDVKPANVLVLAGEDGASGTSPVRVKVLDYGLAKAIERSSDTGFQTRGGPMFGTPYYVAPERCRGEPVGPASDVYSLGVMLYEALTGALPFDDTTFMGVVGKHMHEVPLDPRQAAPARGIPDELAALCVAMLAKAPARRPETSEVVATLEGLARSLPAGSLEQAYQCVAPTEEATMALHEGVGLAGPATVPPLAAVAATGRQDAGDAKRVAAEVVPATVAASKAPGASLGLWAVGAVLGLLVAIAALVGTRTASEASAPSTAPDASHSHVVVPAGADAMGRAAAVAGPEPVAQGIVAATAGATGAVSDGTTRANEGGTRETEAPARADADAAAATTDAGSASEAGPGPEPTTAKPEPRPRKKRPRRRRTRAKPKPVLKIKEDPYG